ncbi:MAG: HK97 family phage prohead protease, partial [Cohaesibacter sp.]|nr:HK97 family phage prohead protease [Cohaesibacter sp.]
MLYPDHAACAKSASLSMLQKKAAHSTLQSISPTGLFEGYACLFDVEDLGRDVLIKGAFAKSLQRRGLQGIKLLNQHDPAEPLGRWLEIREDDKG